MKALYKYHSNRTEKEEHSPKPCNYKPTSLSLDTNFYGLGFPFPSTYKDQEGMHCDDKRPPG